MAGCIPKFGLETMERVKLVREILLQYPGSTRAQVFKLFNADSRGLPPFNEVNDTRNLFARLYRAGALTDAKAACNGQARYWWTLQVPVEELADDNATKRRRDSICMPSSSCRALLEVFGLLPKPIDSSRARVYDAFSKEVA